MSTAIQLDTLLNTTINQMSQDAPEQFQIALGNFTIGKSVVSVFLILWAIIFSILILYRQRLNEYIQIHQIWFGTESIVLIIARLWFYSVVLILFLPFLQNVLMRVKI